MKVPTAKEFLESRRVYPHIKAQWECEAVYQEMIEFAKIHVTEALKQASEKAELETEYENPVNPSMGSFEVVDRASILDAYSLDNVK